MGIVSFHITWLLFLTWFGLLLFFLNDRLENMPGMNIAEMEDYANFRLDNTFIYDCCKRVAHPLDSPVPEARTYLNAAYDLCKF